MMIASGFSSARNGMIARWNARRFMNSSRVNRGARAPGISYSLRSASDFSS